MYVACVTLRVAGRHVYPGQEVPEADGWQESVKRAHVDLGWIKLLSDGGSPQDQGTPVAQAAAPEAKDCPGTAVQPKVEAKPSKKRGGRKGGALSGPTAETPKNPQRTTSAS